MVACTWQVESHFSPEMLHGGPVVCVWCGHFPLHADWNWMLTCSHSGTWFSCAGGLESPQPSFACAPGGRLLASCWDPRAKAVAKRGRPAEASAGVSGRSAHHHLEGLHWQGPGLGVPAPAPASPSHLDAAPPSRQPRAHRAAIQRAAQELGVRRCPAQPLLQQQPELLRSIVY